VRNSLILHHYELSPFSEKARRLFGFKHLPYRSVRIPAVMPKPDVVALTGGYRKTPIVQAENHVYCDTTLIAHLLEARRPEPTFYPSPLADTVAEWGDATLFEVAIPLGLRPTRFDDLLRWMKPEELQRIGEDRAAMRDGARRSPPSVHACKAHLAVYLGRLERALTERPYLLGDAPCIADFSCYHPAWFLATLAPEPLEPFHRVREWVARIGAIPDTAEGTLSSEDALAIARAGSADWTADAPFTDVTGLSKGQRVKVRAADYGRDPVEGELVHAALDEVVVRREDPRAGTVFVHFPRVGYEVAPG